MYPVLKRHTFASWVFLVLLGLAAWHLFHYYPMMPERMASHFGAGGRADGWAEKDTVFVLSGVMLAFMAAMFGGLALAIPAFPASMVNVPHRDYYLSPENREKSYGIIVSFMLWFGVATTAFMILINEQVFRANLEPEPRLGDEFMIGLVVYLAYTVVATIALLLQFRKPKAA